MGLFTAFAALFSYLLRSLSAYPEYFPRYRAYALYATSIGREKHEKAETPRRPTPKQKKLIYRHSLASLFTSRPPVVPDIAGSL